MNPPSRTRFFAHTIGGRLAALVLLMLVPITCISLVAGLSVYGDEKRVVVSVAQETAKALSLVADRELAVRAAILTTLATSASLDRGDLEAFHREARAVAPTFQNTIVLFDLEGRQLVNTRTDFNTGPLPRGTAFARLSGETTGMAVSDLYMAPLGKRLSFAVRVPVMRDGKVRWQLSMGSFASQLQRVFDQQPLPAGWVGTIVDTQGQVVARNTRAEEYVGRKATPDMLERMNAAPSGVHETRTLDGVPVVTVFNRAPDSGWKVLIGLPRDELQRPAWRAFWSVMATSIIISILALGAARRIARSMVEPVQRLQADAQALGGGEAVEERATGLSEIDAVQRLLSQASRDRTQADARLRAKVAEAVADTERAQRAALSAQKLEALGRLTGGIAHDFNNLLQTMTTGLKLADRLATDPRARHALAACDRAVDKAVKLTRQLMTFGRAQPGRTEVIELWQQFAGMQELLRGAVPASIEMAIDIPQDVWRVHVDPVQLELAVLNLTVNARDAIESSGAIQVSARNRTIAEGAVPNLPAGDYVALTVTDDGAGIPADVLPRIFEPFFTTKPLTKGSGLGLAQVYGFARQSGGIATVQSEPGKGTSIAIWLPRTLAASALQEAPAEAARAPQAHRGTVLFVEDDALVRGLVSEGLEELGFAVVVASTADDALALARSRADIDAVLTDVVMPGGRSGIDLAKTLAVLRPALPVLLATGYAESLAQEIDLTVIAKPYRLDNVAAMLTKAIHASPLKAG